MGYWQDRTAQAQNEISNKSIKDINKQMIKYYKKTIKKVMSDFEATHNKLLNSIQDGLEPTPADLYKLEKYWVMQAQTKAELEKLGEKQIALLTKSFERNWFEIYNSINISGSKAFHTIDKAAVKQMLNNIWVADGKSWSSRIWDNTSLLLDTLNDELIHCVAAGKSTNDLKKLLQKRFSVSYSRADALVRTEMAHIQTQAAQQRYKDYGIQMVEVWADKDERRCEKCGKLHQKKYPINAEMPIPAHPKCRCCIVPVVD